MRALLIPAFILIVATTVAAQARPQRRPSAEAQRQTEQFREDQKAIAQLQHQEIEANMAFDLEKLVSLYTEDVVLLPPDQEAIRGKEALRLYYEQARKQLGNTDILGYEETWDEVQISGDWAFQIGTITERTQAAAGGKETMVVMRAMRILKREPDGAWLIARAMWNHGPAATSAPATPK